MCFNLLYLFEYLHLCSYLLQIEEPAEYISYKDIPENKQFSFRYSMFLQCQNL